MRVSVAGAAVPVVDVGAHQVHIEGAGPRVGRRGGAGEGGPQEPEVLKYGMPGLTHDQLLTNVELYGHQVIPRVRELLS